MNLKKILLFIFICNTMLMPINLKSNDKAILTLIVTSMGFTSLATIASNMCAFYDKPQMISRSASCNWSAGMNNVALFMIVCAICLYCKKKSDRQVARVRIAERAPSDLGEQLMRNEEKQAAV